jgi:hypothetical protein
MELKKFVRNMRKVLKLNVEDVTPTANEVLELQGMAGRKNLPAKITQLLDAALAIFSQLAEPQGIFEEFSINDFPALYEKNGMSSPEGPVMALVSKADAIALFTATMGNSLATKSSELFSQGGAVLGYMMDAVNSSGAERLGKLMCQQFLEHLQEALPRSKDLKAQYYCPGHCGWHISGQAELFEALRPEEIGIALRPNFVMHPFKSISGLLVAGDITIHRFQPGFSFCPQCKEHKCEQRLRLLEKTI